MFQDFLSQLSGDAPVDPMLRLALIAVILLLTWAGQRMAGGWSSAWSKAPGAPSPVFVIWKSNWKPPSVRLWRDRSRC